MTQEEIHKTAGFEAARARLISIAYRMLGSRAEAEDVVQDAWLKWHAAASGELHTPLAWLTTVTTRLAIDRIRRLQSEQAARASELTQPWLDEQAPSAEDEALHASTVSEAVKLLFERLSADERAAFVLHEAFDCDYAQIAEVVGKTPAHCRQLAHRARRRLTDEHESGADRSRRDRGAQASRMEDAARLLEIIHRADGAGAMRLLTEREVPVAAADSVVSRRASVSAGSLAEDPMTCAGFTALELHALPRDCGAALALVQDCEVVGVLRLKLLRASSGYALVSVTLKMGGAEVEALNGRFGSHAIKQMLRRIAGAQSTTVRCAA
ncbi:sigma-70 family RNA polymerase sigma factor [Trinickia soli]|uniref:RNA polymerase subunit sigma-24 n=1 Tax=Trinickia soli TaxID=380675 RepID=A0A2N7WAR0_9BURK|nr:sigma-70 family RNA polymerase sigma factor [Trinickia soli]PMS26484.1 RNA polymerase subunit sigma-24 [Trinickia soli]CAB3719449.1 hypothetical protein LMG24076_04545 [Trinickia soli]